MRRSFSRSFGVKKGQSMISIKTISCIKRVSSGFKILITDLRPKSINLQLLQLTKRSHINSQLIQWPMCPFDHVGARDRMGLNKTQPLWSSSRQIGRDILQEVIYFRNAISDLQKSTRSHSCHAIAAVRNASLKRSRSGNPIKAVSIQAILMNLTGPRDKPVISHSLMLFS